MSLELCILNSLRVRPFNRAYERGSVVYQRYLGVLMALHKTTILINVTCVGSHLAFCVIREQSYKAASGDYFTGTAKKFGSIRESLSDRIKLFFRRALSLFLRSNRGYQKLSIPQPSLECVPWLAFLLFLTPKRNVVILA